VIASDQISDRAPWFNVLGNRISSLTLDRTLELLGDRISSRTPAYVSVCTVHTIVEGLRSAEVRRAVNGAWLATADGMPLVWWGRIASHSAAQRVYGPDLLEASLTDPRHRQTRHFFYGGAPGVAEELIRQARRINPDLQVAGHLTPPFRPLTEAEESETVRTIDASRADIVWVGLGCPKQDLWMARFRPRLAAPVLIGVGAAFDFLAGAKRQAPRFMQRVGLEWLFRLASEPTRLWRRYLVGNSVFLAHTMAHLAGWRRYPIES
jgi:N-acetylglucosaminyldiphosphoundecaprenol N-acetyl-beta-D-mannosaminyltransferase